MQCMHACMQVCMYVIMYVCMYVKGDISGLELSISGTSIFTYIYIYTFRGIYKSDIQDAQD